MNYFIVTKPLQYFNCLNIKTYGKRVLIFVNSFYNANEFFIKTNEAHNWDNSFFFNCENSAYKFIYKSLNKDDTLFIDSDYGITSLLRLCRVKTKEIYVYEEGVGSYRDDLLSRHNYSYVKNFLYKLFGVKNHMGGSRFVKGLYIYDVQKHIQMVPRFKNKRLSFEHSFIENLSLNTNFLLDNDRINFYSEAFKDKDVHLYLTSWQFNEKIVAIFDKIRDESILSSVAFIIKPHPHMKSIDFNYKFCHVIPGDLMIEPLLQILSNKSSKLVVYHENSSCMQYLPNIENYNLLR